MSDSQIMLKNIQLELHSDSGPVHILRGINLEIAKGETVGVVGPSGSGKTSLLMVLAGLEPATSGTLTSAGQVLGNLDEDGLARYRRDHMGIVFQGFHLIPTMTALENVAIPLEFSGQSDAFGRAEQELHAVGLGHRLSHFPGQMSGGEQQRVALARSFVTGPDILLADEPTGSLDQATGHKILDLMFELKDRQGTTLIMVTHSSELAARCSRLIRLEDGLIVGDDAGGLVTSNTDEDLNTCDTGEVTVNG